MSKLLEMHKTYRMTKDEKNIRINSGEVMAGFSHVGALGTEQ